MTVTRSQNPGALACGTTVSRRIWRLPGAANTHTRQTHTLYFFSITTQFAKGFRQNSPNWQSIRLLLWQNWRSTVLAVFGKTKSGDFHSKSGDREIFIILSKIGRLGSSACDCARLSLARRQAAELVICTSRHQETAQDWQCLRTWNTVTTSSGQQLIYTSAAFDWYIAIFVWEWKSRIYKLA